jgi:hypothetical protein
MKIRTTILWEIKENWASPKDLDILLRKFEWANPVQILSIEHKEVIE